VPATLRLIEATSKRWLATCASGHHAPDDDDARDRPGDNRDQQSGDKHHCHDRLRNDVGDERLQRHIRNEQVKIGERCKRGTGTECKDGSDAVLAMKAADAAANKKRRRERRHG
jgi:hypothetical protein